MSLTRQQRALLSLAGRGRVRAIRRLLAEGTDIATQDFEGRTPLHMAALNGHTLLVDLLISEGADVASRDKTGQTPLHLAAAEGHERVVELLLDKGVHVDPVDTRHETPLHLAVKNEHNSTIEMLLDRGANPGGKAEDAWLAEYLAEERHREQAQERASAIRSAPCYITDGLSHMQRAVFFLSSGDTPLHEAISCQHTDIAARLLAHGADVNAQNRDGWRPLHSAAFLTREIDALSWLLANGADVSTVNKDGWTALHLAVLRARQDKAKLLLSRGADINAKNSDGWTPLHVAIEARAEIVHDLDHAKYDRDAGKWKPAPARERAAAVRAYAEMTEWLLANGAEVNTKDAEGSSPLHVAAARGQTEVVESLLDRGAQVNAHTLDGWTPLHQACKLGHVVSAKLLLARGAAINGSTDEGWTALHAAVANRHPEVVELLLAHGADVRAEGRHDPGWLLLATARGDADVIRQGLNDAVEAHIKGEDGLTALRGTMKGRGNYDTILHWASFAGNASIVDQLLRRGADANARNEDDVAPLHYAAAEGHADTVELLLAFHANVNAKDKEGWTPLAFAARPATSDSLFPEFVDVAAITRQQEVVQMLQREGAESSVPVGNSRKLLG
jgi:ankyrin repeat protein